MIPTLTTERLVLRPPRMDDHAVYLAFVTSDRARHMGGPHAPQVAWEWLCNDTAQWHLMNMGALIITHQGRAVGQVSLIHGPHFPEPELGWFLFDAADEGQGFAHEAAVALRDWALGPRGLPTVVSYIDADNAPSRRLAEKLGARRDRAAATPAGMATEVWRIDAGPRLETARLVLRRPAPRDVAEAAAFWASERSHLMGGPWTSEVTAANFADVMAQWPRNGFGLFTVTERGQDRAIGLVGPFCPEGYPEVELAWSLFDPAHEGKGLAHEAAVAARDWFWSATGRSTMLSYTHVDNHRSHRLCERLGAVVDPDAPSPSPPPERIYRHHAGGRA